MNVDEQTIYNATQKALRDFEKDLRRKEQNKALHDTYELMDNYTCLKGYHKKAISEANQIGMDNDSTFISKIRKSKVKTTIIIAHVEECLKQLERDAKIEHKEYEYQAFYLYYIERKTYEDIQVILNCGKNSPSRWCKCMIKKLSVKLFGIDGLKRW